MQDFLKNSFLWSGLTRAGTDSSPGCIFCAQVERLLGKVRALAPHQVAVGRLGTAPQILLTAQTLDRDPASPSLSEDWHASASAVRLCVDWRADSPEILWFRISPKYPSHSVRVGPAPGPGPMGLSRDPSTSESSKPPTGRPGSLGLSPGGPSL